MKTLKILFLLLFTASASEIYSQRHGGGNRGARHAGHHARHNKVVVVKRSPYRPRTIVAYHPYWQPGFTYRRRWIYFPRYNFYWDNWRNHYLFWNGTIWISQPAPPPVVVNVNLEKEKKDELKESEDDIDDVYKLNDQHKTEYKSD
jgi:hypothetical protein